MFRLSITCAHCHKVFQGSIAQLTTEISCPRCLLAVPFPNAPAGECVWVVAQGQHQVGPFATLQLTDLAASRQLTPEHMVLLQGASQWQEAKTVPGLFPPIDAEEMPKLVVDLPAWDSTEDALSGATTAHTPLGPLSLKGIKVNLNFSLTLGDFQIFHKVGAGGMGAVYLARQRSLDRFVALKVLSDSLASKNIFVDRFLREVTILASLDHPNIVKFIGVGQEKGIPFFAMEFIEGYSAGFLVKQKGKLAVGDALCIIQKSALGLGYVAAQKIVHRDIKPENIMITREGEIKIADLGLAKSLENLDLDLTDTGTTLGSPKYMAPEQSRNAKFADHRSDIFALGGVLYYLLTGTEPFKGETPMELALAKEKKMFVPARRLNAEVPPRLDLIIDKMLAKEPKSRYQGYAELIGDLGNLGLTHESLSFDAAELLPVDQSLPAGELVEVLLIDNDLDDARLAKQALEENHICSNLVVVKDGAEARAFLRREGPFLLAPQPGLIIFGSQLNPVDSLLTLEEIKASETLSQIPLVVLASSDDTGRFFEMHGYQVRVLVTVPDDPNLFDSFFKSVQGLCLTVMEVKPTD
jgi:serine/threonine protein kinase